MRPKYCITPCPMENEENCIECWEDFEADVAKINEEENMKIEMEEVTNDKTN